jgi:hypothetical protein
LAIHRPDAWNDPDRETCDLCDGPCVPVKSVEFEDGKMTVRFEMNVVNPEGRTAAMYNFGTEEPK